MTVYTRKNGKYTPLTKDQIHKLQRRDHVLAVQREAVLSANALLAIAKWMAKIAEQRGRVDDADLQITTGPSIKYLMSRVVGVKDAVAVLQRGTHGRT